MDKEPGWWNRYLPYFVTYGVALGVWSVTTIYGIRQDVAVQRQRIEVQELKVSTIEQNGSRGLQTHEALDSERIVDIKNRLTAVETAIVTLVDVKSRLAAIDERLSAVATRLNAQQEALNKISEHLLNKKGTP